MRKSYITVIDSHLETFRSQGENFGKNVDETISQLEQVILTAQAEITQLQSLRKVVTRFTWPDYNSPEMPQTATLETTQEPDQMKVTLDDTDDASLEQKLAESLDEKTDTTGDETKPAA